MNTRHAVNTMKNRKRRSAMWLVAVLIAAYLVVVLTFGMGPVELVLLVALVLGWVATFFTWARPTRAKQEPQAI